VTTMRAIRIHDALDLRLEAVPRPHAGEGEIVLEITGAGVCGTDSALYRLGRAVIPDGVEARWPIVLGHEFAGCVVEVGRGVQTLSEGDLVASGAGVSCGRCAPCTAGRTNLCEHYWTTGVHRDGGLAQYCAVPAAVCERAADHGVHGDAAALAQPMAIASHAVARGRLQEGERALIFGAGGIGSFATWVAASLGAHVTVCDRDSARLATARALGARAVLDTSTAALQDLLTDDPQWDVVYEMTGAAGPLAAAVAHVRPGGRLVVAGVHPGGSEIDLARLGLQEIDLLGTMAHVRATDLPHALDLLGARAEGWADVAPQLLSLDAVLEQLTAGRPSEAIKTLVDPFADVTRRFEAVR
jgi:(R,R)-butanediol dehydrogenase/meso-butanediol dehydrogenase/diacetyl reductase